MEQLKGEKKEVRGEQRREREEERVMITQGLVLSAFESYMS